MTPEEAQLWQVAADMFEDHGYAERAKELRARQDQQTVLQAARSLILKNKGCTHIFAGPKQHREIIGDIDSKTMTLLKSPPSLGPPPNAVFIDGVRLVLDEKMDGIRVVDGGWPNLPNSPDLFSPPATTDHNTTQWRASASIALQRISADVHGEGDGI